METYYDNAELMWQMSKKKLKTGVTKGWKSPKTTECLSFNI